MNYIKQCYKMPHENDLCEQFVKGIFNTINALEQKHFTATKIYP